MKLISMTDFVLEQDTNWSYKNTIVSIRDYANFLKQTLELWMFVPCDENGNVLEEPNEIGGIIQYPQEMIDYQQAKERCLFEGWELVHNGKWGAEIAKDKATGYWQFNISQYKRVEYLLWDRQLQLTTTAIKQLGL